MIHELVQSSLPDQKKYKLSFLDRFLMTAMKLRLNLQFETLADMFKSSKTTLQRIFWKWVNILYVKLAFLIKWPDHDASAKTLPHVFRQYFPRLTGIIDCTEIFIERPRSLKARAEVCSNYKRHSTAKVLIACTPQGAVSFVSKVWGGRVSDVDLVRDLDLLVINTTTVEIRFWQTEDLHWKMSLLLSVVLNLLSLASQKESCNSQHEKWKHLARLHPYGYT